jgi:hypothetical protein
MSRQEILLSLILVSMLLIVLFQFRQMRLSSAVCDLTLKYGEVLQVVAAQHPRVTPQFLAHMMADSEVIQVQMLAGHRRAFMEWLMTRDLTAVPMPDQAGAEIVTYMVVPAVNHPHYPSNGQPSTSE